MKKIVSKQTHFCDMCGKEDDYPHVCMNCGKEMCYDCRKKHGVEYTQGVHFSGSGDGYYCKECDLKLTTNGKDKLHAAYRAITSLRLENKAYWNNFEKRSKEAESTLQSCIASN